MRRQLLVIVVAALASICVAQTSPAFRCGNGDSASDAPLSGNLELRDLSGKVTSLSDLRGTPLVLNFWATWCPPCRREIPQLVEIQKKYGGAGLRVVGISLDDADNPTVAKVAADAGVNYLLLFGSLDTSLAFVGAQGLPVTLFIRRDGTVCRKVLGILTARELEANAVDLMKASAAK